MSRQHLYFLSNRAKIFTLIGVSTAIITSFTPSMSHAFDEAANDTFSSVEQVSGFYLGGHSSLGWGKASNAEITGVGVGIHGGHHWQYQRAVISMEADLTYSNLKFKAFSSSFKAPLTGTTRIKAGFLFDRWMVYASTGLAAAKLENHENNNHDKKNAIGWTAGAGVEAPINKKISVRGEFLHQNFGSNTFQMGTTTRKIDTSVNVIRTGVNYRF